MPNPTPSTPNPNEQMNINQLKEGLHTKLVGKEVDPTKENRKLKIQELIREEITKAGLNDKADYRNISKYRGIAVNAFAKFVADTLKDLLKGQTPEEQERLLTELATELGIDEVYITEFIDQNTKKDKKGNPQSQPTRIEAISRILAEKYSFMSISIDNADNATPAVDKSGEMTPKVVSAITKASDTYIKVYGAADDKFSVAITEFKNQHNQRPPYRLDELQGLNPPFTTPQDFNAWKDVYSKNLKQLYLILEDLPFHLALGDKTAEEIASKLGIKEEKLKDGHTLPDCEILQGVDLLYRNSKKLRTDKSRTNDDLLFAAESYYWWRNQESKSDDKKVSKPKKPESPEKISEGAKNNVAIAAIKNIVINNGIIGNLSVGDNNNLDQAIYPVGSDILIDLDDTLSSVQIDAIIIELEAIFGQGCCTKNEEGDIVVQHANEKPDYLLEDNGVLDYLNQNGVKLEDDQKYSVQRLQALLAQFNVCATKKLHLKIQRGNIATLDCHNKKAVFLILKLFAQFGIKLDCLQSGTQIIIVLKRGQTHIKDKVVDDSKDDDNDIFGTDGEKYHELLEDGKTKSEDILKARRSRIEGVQTKVRNNLLLKYRPGTLNTPAEKLDALTTAFDTYLADANQLFKDRQDYRLSKQWGVTKAFNKVRKAVSLEPGKARYLSIAARIGLTVGAGCLAGPLAGTAVGFGFSTLAMRRVASKGLLKARTLSNSDASLHNNLAIYQQMNIRKTIDPSEAANNTGVYAEHEKNAKTAQDRLKKLVQDKLKQEPHLSVLKSKTTTPEQKIDTILKVMSEEQNKLFEAMERERDKLNRIRAAEWLGAAAMAGAIMFATHSLYNLVTGGPDPVPPVEGGNTPPVPPVEGGNTPPVPPVEGGNTPPVPPVEGGNTPPVPTPPPVTDPLPGGGGTVTVPPMPNPIEGGEVLDGVVRIEDADYLRTFQANYDPATALVDKLDPNTLLDNPANLNGVDVIVDTHEVGSAGNLNLRTFQNGQLIDSDINLTNGDQFTLTGNEMTAQVEEVTNGIVTPMKYLEVTSPTGETGYVNAAFLDRATPLETVIIPGSDDPAYLQAIQDLRNGNGAANTNVDVPPASQRPAA